MKVKKEKKETKKEREKRLDKEFAEYLRALSPKEGKWLMNIAGLCLERFRKMENMEHLSQSQRSEEFGRFFCESYEGHFGEGRRRGRKADAPGSI